MYTRVKTLLGFSSSTITAGPIFIGDAATLSLSVISGSGSAWTVRMSNANGFNAAIPDNTWSVVTTLANQGVYDIEPGARWMDVLQAASSSSNTVIVAFSVRH